MIVIPHPMSELCETSTAEVIMNKLYSKCQGFVTLVLDFPPSLNHMWRQHGRHRPLSEAGRRYRKHVAEAIEHCESRLPLQGRLSVSIMLHRKDRRKYDIDNYAKAVLDSLQHAGVFADDEAVDELVIKRGSIEKHGMCVVQVEKL